MSEGNYKSAGNEGSAPERAYDRPPYWRRMHTSWLFWLGMVLVTVAIVVYVMSDNLAFIPRSHPSQAASGQLGQ